MFNYLFIACRDDHLKYEYDVYKSVLVNNFILISSIDIILNLKKNNNF